MFPRRSLAYINNFLVGTFGGGGAYLPLPRLHYAYVWPWYDLLLYNCRTLLAVSKLHYRNIVAHDSVSKNVFILHKESIITR